MQKIMIILHSEDISGAEVFIDRHYVGAIDKDTYVLDKIIKQLNSEVIKEEINLDSYLARSERDKFYLSSHFFFTEDEQEAILNGEIDYAFDMIKKRLF